MFVGVPSQAWHFEGKKEDKMLKALSVFGAAVVVVSLASTANAALIAGENFDGGAVNLLGTQNVYDYGAGGGSGNDVFGRVSQFRTGGTGMPYDVADDTAYDVSGGGVYPDDQLGIAGGFKNAFFAMNNMDAVGVNNATWTFDVSSAVVEIQHILISFAAMGDFEAASTDGFLIEAQLDGSGYREIFKARTDEDASLTYNPLDGGYELTADDPLELFIDGEPGWLDPIYIDNWHIMGGGFLGGSTAFYGQVGSELDIRLSWTGTPSGSEPMGIDSININGVVPEPAGVSLLILGGLLVTRRRR